MERAYGVFERSFQLTCPVDASKVKARFEDGVLTITLPKSEESRPREISIDS
jgi:HSP20 family protein